MCYVNFNLNHTCAIMLRLSFLVIIAIGCVRATTFDSCAEPKDPISLRVTGCEEHPCKLVKGASIIAEVEFEVAHDTETLRPRVLADALGIKGLPYPLPQQDACQALTNAECPLDEGEQVTYKLEMPIMESYPKISLTIQLSLVDQNDNTLACFRLRGSVVDPSS